MPKAIIQFNIDRKISDEYKGGITKELGKLGNVIEIRGHHIKDILDYFHDKNAYLKKNIIEFGYGKESIYTMAAQMEALKDPSKKFKFVDEPDEVCKKCNFKTDDGCKFTIKNREGIEKIVNISKEESANQDKQETLRYNFKLNQEYTANEIIEKLKSRYFFESDSKNDKN